MRNYIMKKQIEYIKLWKELNIEKVEIPFNCGGDSMGDLEVILYDKEGNVVNNEELKDYFEGDVYNEVDFYEVSDGHYLGESGTVYVEFEEDEEDDNGGGFVYTKDAMSEFNEHFTETMYIELNEKEVELLTTKIHSFMGGEDGDAVNYKDDCILTDEEDEMIEALVKKVDEMAREHEFNVDSDAEASDWYRFSTNLDEDDAPIQINDKNELLVEVEASFYSYYPSED